MQKDRKEFRQKIPPVPIFHEEGVMMGLESKTSSSVQAVRGRGGHSEAVENLYISGEGSGWAGGIVSSAADGNKAAFDIIKNPKFFQ